MKQKLLEYQYVVSTTDEQLYSTINTIGVVKKTNPIPDDILVRETKNESKLYY